MLLTSDPDGISFSDEKVYVCFDPAFYAAGKTASPYVYQGDRSSGGGYIKKVEPLGRNPLIQYATEVGGSNATYYADYAGVYGSVLAVGGYWDSASNAGVWSWDGACDPSIAGSVIGGRLCYKPSQST